jgi:hypothetical protein
LPGIERLRNATLELIVQEMRDVPTDVQQGKAGKNDKGDFEDFFVEFHGIVI